MKPFDETEASNVVLQEELLVINTIEMQKVKNYWESILNIGELWESYLQRFLRHTLLKKYPVLLQAC